MRMKILIFTLVSILAMSTVALADVPTLGGYLTRGVDSMCYYVDSSASQYITYINSGISRWTNGGHTPADVINMTAVSSNSATDVDYYALGANEDDGGLEYEIFFDEPGTYAETRKYNANEVRVDPSMPYYFARIYFNNSLYPTLSNYNKIGTAAHEFGHALCLYENNDEPDHIMCQLSHGRTVNTVHTEEYSFIEDLYN